MARIKPKDKLPQLQSWDEVDLALCEIAEHTIALIVFLGIIRKPNVMSLYR